MAIIDLYSKRKKRESGQEPYSYDDIPQKLRVQVLHTLNDAIKFNLRVREEFYTKIRKILCEEYGLFNLAKGHTSQEEVTNFVQICNAEQVLDFTELACWEINDNLNRHIASHIAEYDRARMHAYDGSDEVIRYINQRFKENCVGYAFEGNQIIRIDSQLLHAEAVKPAIRFLSEKAYEGPNSEFLNAHRHYRLGNFKEAIAEALKAFESTMKAIFVAKGWTYEVTAPAKKLIDICFANKLIPDYMQSQFSSLRNLLECSVPAIRNKTSGHGQGPESIEVPDHLAGFVLHMTASTILFLAESAKKS